MQMLSDDDVNIAGMTGEELEAAWDLWFDLAQHTNDFDPSYTHGVFIGIEAYDRPASPESGPARASGDARLARRE